MAGWSLCLDAEKPSWFTVDVVVSATQLRLYLKRATTLTAVGKTFRLCPPPFVDAQTGTLGSRDASGNVTFAHAKTQTARLWAGYRYTPPRVGFWNYDSTVIGAQTGTVKLGSHHTDNREYDIYTGRWTTPDPAASPWSNLWDYCGNRALDSTDPSGLFATRPAGFAGALQRWLKLGMPKPGYPTHNSITAEALAGCTNVPQCYFGQVMVGAITIDLPTAFFGGYGDTRAFHCDDLELMHETEAWLKAVRDAAKYLKAHPNCKCGATLARLAGMAAHTIEDFYHHSNWMIVNQGKRWGETAGELGGDIAVGHGWAQKGSRSRESKWRHDPWGDLHDPKDILPTIDGVSDRLAYLNENVKSTVVPHVRDFLNDVFDGRDRNDMNCCGKFDNSRDNLKECFGHEIGQILAQFLRDDRGTAKNWQDIGKLESN